MPIVKVTFEDGRSEEHVLDKDANPEAFAEQLGKSLGVNLKVAVVNPIVHNHQWQGTCGSGYFQRCSNCFITGIKRGSVVVRDAKFASDKHYYCQDPLKKITPFKIKQGIKMPNLKHLD